MRYDDGKQEELKHKFWEAMAGSSFLFLQLNDDPDSAVPMSAQLDKDANSSIWFFSRKDSAFANLGTATATFAGKGHNMWARFQGELSVETSFERFDQMWNNFVEAWYDEGKTDPNMLFLRMDLGQAEIWGGDLGVLTVAKMALGMTVIDEAEQKHTKTAL